MSPTDTELYIPGTNIALDLAAISYSDAVVIADENINDEVLNFVKKQDKPTLALESTINLECYNNFYQEIASEELLQIT